MKGFSVLFVGFMVICTWVCNYRVEAHLQTGDFLLESYPSYSIVLPLIGGPGNPTDQSFVVQSPRFHRVMAVIQFLNLPPTNDFTCTNFLQFQDGAEKRSDKICGNFDPDEKGFDPPSLIGSRSYLSSRETLKVSLVTPSSNGQTSYARIAFTAFREDCYFSHPKNWTSGQPRYRPCEYSVNEDGIGRQCIVSNLFCDEILNCAGIDDQGQDFAQDESQLNCPHIYHLKETFSSTSSGHSSVSSVNDSFVDNSTISDGGIKGTSFRDSSGETSFKKFFDEREEHLANLFKSAIIGFVGICTICILTAFVVTMFCLRSNNDSEDY